MSLEVQNGSVTLEGLPILDDISLRLDTREVVSVVGANGAGKSTLLRAIMGLIHPVKGRIGFNGAELAHRPPSA